MPEAEAARHDLVEHFVYLAEEAGLEVAERFFANAEASFNGLARQPKMGAPLTLKIFYEHRPDGASIVRVLHGAAYDRM